MIKETDLKNKTINGMFWQFLQKTGAQLIGFVVSVILARLLAPEDYGVVALAGMFLVLMGVFSDGGLGQALIQKKEQLITELEAYKKSLIYEYVTGKKEIPT